MTKNWSLATTLTLWFTASAFLLITLATSAMYWSLVHTLNIEDGLYISDKAQAIVALLNSDATGLTSIKARVEKEWATRRFERIYVNVLDHEGRTITETPGFQFISGDLFHDVPISEVDHPNQTVERRETATGRVFKLEILRTVVGGPQGKGEIIIRLALDRTREEEFLAAYRSRFLTILAVMLFVAAFIGRRIAIRGIQPVSDIAEAAKNIRSTTLHERISSENVPVELKVLVITFNEMLDRLNESFERLSRFSADIAHDLRTPLNNLMGELEVTLGRTRSPEQYQDVLGSCLEEGARISHLIDSLLFLSRAEDPGEAIKIESIELKHEVMRLTEFFEASASEAGITLENNVPADIRIRSDRALLQRALGNGLANAVKHTQKGGTVTVSASVQGTWHEIVIRDTGIGIAPEHLRLVFDRFYRVDLARSTKSGGSGLGLSIVRGIMQLHRGQADIESVAGKGTALKLRFPASES